MNKQVAGARKFKIVIIIDAWYPIIGGGQVHVWEISKRIVKDEDVYVEIVTRKLKNEEGELFNKDEYSYNGKLKIKRLGLTSHWNNFFGEVTYLIHLIIYLLINKYDLIHVQPFLPALPGKLVSLIRNKPLIVTVHGTRLFESNRPKTLDIWLERVILTKIKYNLQISVTRAFLNIKNINKEKVVIPNGLDLKRFNQIKAKKNLPTQILWVGRFDSIKRVSDLIYAMKILNSKNTTLKLKLVGYGYKINEIKDLIKINRVSNIEVAGLKMGQELINEYKKSDLFILSSSSEGQPLTLLEAQASGLPVVATNVGGIPEIIKNGKNGILVEVGNYHMLAEAVLEILNNKKKYMVNSIKFSKSIPSWDKIADLTYTSYQKVINESKN